MTKEAALRLAKEHDDKNRSLTADYVEVFLFVCEQACENETIPPGPFSAEQFRSFLDKADDVAQQPAWATRGSQLSPMSSG